MTNYTNEANNENVYFCRHLCLKMNSTVLFIQTCTAVHRRFCKYHTNCYKYIVEIDKFGISPVHKPKIQINSVICVNQVPESENKIRLVLQPKNSQIEKNFTVTLSVTDTFEAKTNYICKTTLTNFSTQNPKHLRMVWSV